MRLIDRPSSVRHRAQRACALLLIGIAACVALGDVRAGTQQGSDPWLKDPALSPDGSRLAFRANGDIQVVDIEGGAARALMVTPAFERSPVWSADGRALFYASDATGDHDVYVQDTNGGEPRRLTFHARPEYPLAATAEGGVIFKSIRRDLNRWEHDYPPPVSFLNGVIPGGDPRLGAPHAFSIRSDGRGIAQIFAGAIDTATTLPDGRVLYSELQTAERPARRRGSPPAVQRLWLFDSKQDTHRLIYDGGAAAVRSPVYSAADNSVYFLRDEGRSVDVWRVDLSSHVAVEVAKSPQGHATGLTVSATGALVIEAMGRLYVLDRKSQRYRRLQVRLPTSPSEAPRADFVDAIMDAVPDETGEGVYGIAAGRLAWFRLDGSDVRWLEDKSAVMASLTRAARNGEVYALSQSSARSCIERITRSSQRLNATAIACRPDLWSPSISPDGKWLLAEGAGELLLIDVEHALTHVVFDRSSGFPTTPAQTPQRPSAQPRYTWLPDSSGFAVEVRRARAIQRDIVLIALNPDPGSTGRSVIPVVGGGFEDVSPGFSPDGRKLFWRSNREGSIKANSRIAPFHAYELALPDAEAGKQSLAQAWSAAVAGRWMQPLRRATPMDLSIEHLLAGADKHLYALNASAQGLSIVEIDGQASTAIRVAALSGLRGNRGHLEVIRAAIRAIEPLSNDQLLVLAHARLFVVDRASFSARALTVDLHRSIYRRVEYARLFDRVEYLARETFDRGRPVDRDFAQWVPVYRNRLPAIATDSDFAELVDELMGQLDASHTWYTYGHDVAPTAGSLGVIWKDWNALHAGYEVELLPGSPLSSLKATGFGEAIVIQAVNGKALREDTDPAAALAEPAANVTVDAIDSASGRRQSVQAGTLSLEAEWPLLYERWLTAKMTRAQKLSAGAVTYGHLPALTNEHYQQFFDRVMTVDDRKGCGLVVDLRFNTGGWMHERLTSFLQGKLMFGERWRGIDAGVDPSLAWTSRSAMLVNGAAYSNAAEVPRVYRSAGIGPLVGEPVPASGSGLYFEVQPLPQFALWMASAPSFTPAGELWESVPPIQPDISVTLTPEDLQRGNDPQLDAAIRALVSEGPGSAQCAHKP